MAHVISDECKLRSLRKRMSSRSNLYGCRSCRPMLLHVLTVALANQHVLQEQSALSNQNT